MKKLNRAVEGKACPVRPTRVWACVDANTGQLNQVRLYEGSLHGLQAHEYKTQVLVVPLRALKKAKKGRGK